MNKGMLVRLVPVLLCWLPLVGALRAEEAAVSPQAGAETLPAPAILDLFGNQSPVRAAEAPESQRELKRSQDAEAAPVAASSEQRKVIARPSARDAAAWRLRDMLPLAAVLGLIIAIALVVRRFLPGRKMLSGGGVMEIMARCVISGRQSMALVRIGRKLLVVGVSPERLNTLCVVEDPDEVALLLGELASQQPNSISQAFRNSFVEEAERYEGMPEEDTASAVRGQVQRLIEKIRAFKNGRDVA